MKALVLKDYETAQLELTEKETPTPKPGEVLVKMHSAPINPSDLMFLRGLYGIKKKLPTIPGFEGSGTISALGDGVSGWKVGDRVSVTAPRSYGCWAEYMPAPVETLIRLHDDITLEEGSMIFVNPLTAYALLDMVVKRNSKAFVQTAAASALGKMLIRLGNLEKIPSINIVRKDSQIEELKAIGAEHVLNSESPKFEREFAKLCKELEARVCLDAVSGKLASQILTLLPPESSLICYGALSEEMITVNAGIMLFANKKVEGYWLSSWIYTSGPEELKRVSDKVQKNLKTLLKSDVRVRFSLSNGLEAIESYKQNMSGGKTLITMEN